MQVRVVRSGLVESVHHGAAVATSIDGSTLIESGDTDRIFFLRSTAKPFQAAVVLELLDELDVETTAVICASHDGLPVHVALIERLLASVGLDERSLATPPSWPSSMSAARRVVADGHTAPRSIWHNCSGKHAGMLAACVAQRWPIDGYADPGHPLQRAMAAHMVELCGPETLPVGVDGCGAPVFRGSTRSLARAFATLVAEQRYLHVVRAMSRFPVLASGPGNADAAIAVWLGGLAKRGAEGSLGIALPDRGAIAIKIWDGAERAVATAAHETLSRLGWIPHGSRKNLESALTRLVFGGGKPVGTVEAALDMEYT